jgi:hypothetical protein
MTAKQMGREKYMAEKRDDKAVLSKESLTMDDAKYAVSSDMGGTERKVHGSMARTAVVVAFGALLFIGGLYIAILTSLTGFGIIVGVIGMIAGVAVPFVALRR